MEGRIIKGIAGFYYVKIENQVIECKARGKFRHNEISPMVGDRVHITLENGKGTIDEIVPRENILLRPTVANVTQALIVFALKSPNINLALLNRFLVLCEYSNLHVVVCLNKLDLVSEEEKENIITLLKDSGYEVLLLKAKEGFGIEKIQEKLKNNITVLCGPSGVGKSTILNALVGKTLMETGDVSKKLGTGKHTTRHSELIEYEDGFIVDTPGFSSLEIDFIKKEDLKYCFPEYEEYAASCKYTGCLHHKEPHCAVKEAVEENKINKFRYNFYISMLEEIGNSRRNKK